MKTAIMGACRTLAFCLLAGSAWGFAFPDGLEVTVDGVVQTQEWSDARHSGNLYTQYDPKNHDLLIAWVIKSIPNPAVNVKFAEVAFFFDNHADGEPGPNWGYSLIITRKKGAFEFKRRAYVNGVEGGVANPWDAKATLIRNLLQCEFRIHMDENFNIVPGSPAGPKMACRIRMNTKTSFLPAMAKSPTDYLHFKTCVSPTNWLAGQPGDTGSPASIPSAVMTAVETATLTSTFDPNLKVFPTPAPELTPPAAPASSGAETSQP